MLTAECSPDLTVARKEGSNARGGENRKGGNMHPLSGREQGDLFKLLRKPDLFRLESLDPQGYSSVALTAGAPSTAAART